MDESWVKPRLYRQNKPRDESWVKPRLYWQNKPRDESGVKSLLDIFRDLDESGRWKADIQARNFIQDQYLSQGKWSAGVRKSLNKTRIWLDTAEEAERAYNDANLVRLVSTLTSGEKSQHLPDDLSWPDDVDFGSEMCLGEFANDSGGILSHSNNFTAQEENKIAQPVNETYTFQHFPSVELDWDAILQNERVAVGNNGLLDDSRVPVSQFQGPVLPYLRDEVFKELPVQDAGLVMNAESFQFSNIQTIKSPPLQEIEKEVVLDHLHQIPEVEDSIHKKGLVVGAEKYDSYIHALDTKCIDETLKEGKSPEKFYSYDILSAHFGKRQDDAAKYFNVSRSTFKRICRDNGIKRWQSHKKKLDSQGSSKLRRVNNEEPSRTNSYWHVISPLQETDMITVKATYNDIAIKFEVLDSSGIVDLEDNVIERLKMKRDTFSIKYQDEDGDWVLIACDKDLQKCIKTSRFLKTTTIKMMVDRPINHHAS